MEFSENSRPDILGGEGGNDMNVVVGCSRKYNFKGSEMQPLKAVEFLQI